MLGYLDSGCIEGQDALIPVINRTQPARHDMCPTIILPRDSVISERVFLNKYFEKYYLPKVLII